MLPDLVEGLLRDQRGLATRQQLQSAGLTRSALEWRLSRDWRLVLPRVVCAGPHRLDPGHRLIAAGLFAGADGVITSLAAAARHGVTAADGRPQVHVLVPHARRVSGSGFVVIRRTTMIELHPFVRGPILLASPARAVADAGRDCATADAARAIVIEAVQRRIVRVEDLRHQLEAGPRRGSAILRAAVQDAEAGAWSVPEADLAAVAGRSRTLPPLWLNPDLAAADGTRLPRPDGWLDDVGLAIQVHSRAYHGDLDAWDATVMSDGVYAEHGVVVVAVTPRQLRVDPAAVLRRIERAYLTTRNRPRPAVTATPIGHGLVSRSHSLLDGVVIDGVVIGGAVTGAAVIGGTDDARKVS